MYTFCQLSYHIKCQLRGVGGQKSQNLVNVVCEGSLWTTPKKYINKQNYCNFSFQDDKNGVSIPSKYVSRVNNSAIPALLKAAI